MRKALVLIFLLVISIQPAYANSSQTEVHVPLSNVGTINIISNGTPVQTVHVGNPVSTTQPPTTIPTATLTVMPTIIYRVIYRTVTPTLTPTATPSATPTKAPTPTKTPSHRTTKQNSNVFQKIARFFQNIFHFFHVL